MTEVKLDFDKQGGLVPVIVTDYKTGQPNCSAAREAQRLPSTTLPATSS